MQIGLTAFMVALVASWSERKATALTTQQCALVPVDRTSLAHDMEQSAFYTFWTRAVVRLGMQRQWSHERRRVSICLFPAWRSGEAREPPLQ